MSVFIQHHADGFKWGMVHNGQVEQFYGSLTELANFYQTHSDIKQWVLVASAMDVAKRTIHFSDKERRHIRKAVPFLLEDELLSEADDLHIIYGKLQKSSMDVLAIDKDLLTEWLAALSDAGIKVSHCVAESQLLPEAQDTWQLFYHDGVFIVRVAEQPVLAFAAEHLSLSLELLTAHYAELPAFIELYADDEQQLALAQQAIPAALQHLIQTQTQHHLSLWQQHFQQQGKLWNFLQGQFARNSEWLLSLKPWRWFAATLGLALTFHTVLLYSDFRYEKQRSVELRQQLDAELRKAIPQGQIVDHRRQIDRLLSALRGGGSQQQFIEQLEKVGGILAKHKVSQLNALNYEQDKSEVRLDMLVDSYDQLQTMIDDLRALNLEVEIQNSNAQGEQLRARVRIKA